MLGGFMSPPAKDRRLVNRMLADGERNDDTALGYLSKDQVNQSVTSAKVFALPSEMLKSLVVRLETASGRYSNACEAWTIQSTL
jgi:hypothetical protein